MGFSLARKFVAIGNKWFQGRTPFHRSRVAKGEVRRQMGQQGPEGLVLAVTSTAGTMTDSRCLVSYPFPHSDKARGKALTSYLHAGYTFTQTCRILMSIFFQERIPPTCGDFLKGESKIGGQWSLTALLTSFTSHQSTGLLNSTSASPFCPASCYILLPGPCDSSPSTLLNEHHHPIGFPSSAATSVHCGPDTGILRELKLIFCLGFYFFCMQTLYSEKCLCLYLCTFL